MLKGKFFLSALAALAVVVLVGPSTGWTQTRITPSPQEQYLLQRGLMQPRQGQQRQAQEQQRLQPQQEQQRKTPGQQRQMQQPPEQPRKAQ